MITLEKFFNALKKIKIDGRWSLGLIIGSVGNFDFSAPGEKVEKIKINSALTTEKIVKKMTKALKEKKWMILEIKDDLASEMFSQLKLLSEQNRMQSPDGEVVRLADETRVIVLIDRETLKAIEKKYPDFKYLFGPIISI